MIEATLMNLRFAIRVFLTRPLFTIVAVTSLALGIGANTSIFNLINALFLRPLPVEKPEELVAVYRSESKGSGYSSTSLPDYIDFQENNEAFTEIAAHQSIPLSLSIGGEAERIDGGIVSVNYFTLLGVQAAVGRTFLPDLDQNVETNPSVVLSYSLWQHRFGSSADAIGKEITLNSQSFTVLGVAKAGFNGADLETPQEVWIPLAMSAQVMPRMNELVKHRDTHWLELFGRLKPGVALEQAQINMTVLAQQLAQEYPKTNEGWTVTLLPLSQARIWPERRTSIADFLRLLMAGVVLLLLIASANVANLLLAQSATRQKEISIRLALGATRRRLMCQLLTESLLLSLIGGVAAFFLAIWMSNFIAAFKLPSFNPTTLNLTLDYRVFGFTFILTIITSALFGLAPALEASKPDLISTLKGVPGKARTGQSMLNLRSLLVIFQVALSFFLLIGAALFVRSLQRAQAAPLGFVPDKVMLASIDLSLQNYNEQKGKLFYQQLIERLNTLPGADSASLASVIPLGRTRMARSIIVEGQSGSASGGPIEVNANVIAPAYFQTMGIPLLSGRDFGTADGEASLKVAIVNEAMVRRFWPDSNPIGQRFRLSNQNGPLVEIVGIAKDSKYRTLQEEPRASFYLPHLQHYQPRMTIHARSLEGPSNLAGAIRKAIQHLDGNIAVFDVKTLPEQLDVSLSQARMAASFFSIFGLIALILATIGVYGVMCFYVAQRTREIGIRMALGAQQSDVLKSVLRQSLTLVLTGIIIGVAASLALTRVISSLLYNISPTDPVAFSAIALLLAAVGLTASYLPALRASNVDPMIVLRHE